MSFKITLNEHDEITCNIFSRGLDVVFVRDGEVMYPEMVGHCPFEYLDNLIEVLQKAKEEIANVRTP